MMRITSTDLLNVLRSRIPEAWDKPRSVLVVGANPSKFEYLADLQAAGHDLTILEIWEPYADALREQGHRVIVGDVCKPIEGHYDIAFWWNGPEHVGRADLGMALGNLEAAADLVVCGTPWGVFEQGAIDGNPYQIHRGAFYPADFAALGYKVVTRGVQDAYRCGWLVAWKRPRRPYPHVIATVIVYNEEKMLPGCLESVCQHVDRIVVVDGAYAKFPHATPHSTDRTWQIAQCYGVEWFECPPDGWPRQYEKRTAYLVGAEGDWYFNIDADERLIGALPEVEDGQHYAFRIETRNRYPAWVPRLFQHRGWMRYEGSHNALWSGDRLLTTRNAIKVAADRCRFLHLAHLRAVERQAKKGAYYGWQKPAERPYRSTHNI